MEKQESFQRKPALDTIQNANISHFMQLVSQLLGRPVENYSALYQWSIEQPQQFWRLFWDYSEMIADKKPQLVVDNDKMPGARWFPDVTTNFSQNLLRFRDDKPAILAVDEFHKPYQISYQQLSEKTASVQQQLQQLNLQKGDRVAAYMPNIPQTVIAMLATTALGAVWSSTSVDFGTRGVIDRFRQIQPKILVTTDGYSYKGKKISILDRIPEILQQVKSIESILLVPYIDAAIPASLQNYVTIYDDSKPQQLSFTAIHFQDPVYIMYSSGTTGLPKCIVQGPGVLINHKKEHLLHTDLKREDIIFYFTTCGWMMWNWLISALSSGATIVLYEGNPFYPGPEVLWQMVEQLGITIFGTSAKYLATLEKSGYQPGQQHNLGNVRTILSTGSPLLESGYHYVYQHIKSDVQLSSISGGTDLNGCFALGCPIEPVHIGEIQVRGLAMKVEVYSEEGKPLVAEKGELVCSAPFPSMPLYFWNDPNGEKYHRAYFDKFDGVWCHGDFAELTEQNGLIIYGRSDATLNPGGVRIGSAEIYRALEQIKEVVDSVVVSREAGGEVDIILFVKLEQKQVLSEELTGRIKEVIKQKASPRHLPAKILTAPDIPYTMNGKKVEIAVKNAIHKRPITNQNALANPQSLRFFETLSL